jgi:hypothetical protein
MTFLFAELLRHYLKRTTGPKDQQCTDLSPLSLWFTLRSLDEGRTGGDTRPTETRTAARIFNIQFSIFNREWNENLKENVKFHVRRARCPRRGGGVRGRRFHSRGR